VFILMAFAVTSTTSATAEAAAVNDAPLPQAARDGDWDRVHALVASGSPVDDPDIDGATALHWAARAEDDAAVGFLVESGADPNATTRHGVTPLYLAAELGNAAIIERLVKAGADPNQVDITGETMLMIAVQSGDLEAVRVLAAHGADPNTTEPGYGHTALMWAARDGHAPMIESLIAHGADVAVRTRTGEAPEPRLPCINRTGCGSHGIGIVRGGLPERGKRDPIPGTMDALMYAAREGHTEAVGLLLDAGADVHDVDANGIGPLLLAISNNRVETARELIDRGADINAVDWYGRSPLWAAVEMRNVDIHYTTFEHMISGEDREVLLGFIGELLDGGADPNVRIQEVPPLRSWLYLLGGSLSWVDFTGQTPFLLASLSGDIRVMRMLLEHGADPHVPTFEGTTPLMAAAGINWTVNQTYTEWENLPDVVELCWELGMDVNAVNAMGLTAVMGAANRGSNDVIQFLVDKGARLDARDNEGRTALTWAEGVFLATHTQEAKPESIALIQELIQEMGEDASVVASRGTGR
jgi:ankyrin repeat protein